jgi:hypothetical protein
VPVFPFVVEGALDLAETLLVGSTIARVNGPTMPVFVLFDFYFDRRRRRRRLRRDRHVRTPFL